MRAVDFLKEMKIREQGEDGSLVACDFVFPNQRVGGGTPFYIRRLTVAEWETESARVHASQATMAEEFIRGYQGVNHGGRESPSYAGGVNDGDGYAPTPGGQSRAAPSDTVTLARS